MMRPGTIKCLLLLLIAGFALSACNKQGRQVYATTCTYPVVISFRDAQGRDLLESLSEEQISLRIFSQRGDLIEYDRSSGSDQKVSFRIVQGGAGGRRYIEQVLVLPAIEYGLQQKLVYEFTSRALFGDESAHVITTYWDFSQEDITPPLRAAKYPECYGAVFGERKIVPSMKLDGAHGKYCINIALDK